MQVAFAYFCEPLSLRFFCHDKPNNLLDIMCNMNFFNINKKKYFLTYRSCVDQENCSWYRCRRARSVARGWRHIRGRKFFSDYSSLYFLFLNCRFFSFFTVDFCFLIVDFDFLIFSFTYFLEKILSKHLKSVLIDPFMHNVVKWPNILWKSCRCLAILQHYAWKV